MKNILYFNTIEDIKLLDMMRFKKDNKDPYNGHAYVDLGLPSGTLWATMNVGANSETDYGLYFAWGETTGYPDASSGKAFSWNDYAHGTSSSNITKYNNSDNKTVLDLTDDAAAVNWGGQWHMPTIEQQRELGYNTTNGFVASDGTFTQFSWVSGGDYGEPTGTTSSTGGRFNGVAGHLFFKNGVAIADALSNGEYVFLPAAGYCDEGSVYYVGGYGSVWSSSLRSGNVYGARYLLFDGRGASLRYNDRYVGQSVRGVVG